MVLMMFVLMVINLPPIVLPYVDKRSFDEVTTLLGYAPSTSEHTHTFYVTLSHALNTHTNKL